MSSEFKMTTKADLIASTAALHTKLHPDQPGLWQGEETQCPVCRGSRRVRVISDFVICLACHGTGFREPGLEDVLKILEERKLFPSLVTFSEGYVCQCFLGEDAYESHTDPTIAALLCLEAVLRKEVEK